MIGDHLPQYSIDEAKRTQIQLLSYILYTTSIRVDAMVTVLRNAEKRDSNIRIYISDKKTPVFMFMQYNGTIISYLVKTFHAVMMTLIYKYKYI